MKVEFYDYSMRPINPISTKVLALPRDEVDEITTERSRQRIGRHENGVLYELCQITDNYLEITGEVVQVTQLVTEIFKFKFVELNTSEKSYTSFKLIY